MPASKSQLDTFHNTWNQTAAWAQSKGIKYNDYFPIYQQDTQRLLSGGSPMSQSERERAIIAASDPSQVTQKTPSTASNPGNVIGNTVTDARNIFTGIGDIVIHPLHNGLVDSVKNTVDLITGSHHLKGGNFGAELGDALTSTVLSWIPGSSDVGTILGAEYGPGHDKGWMGSSGDPGLSALASHPISSILDVVPAAKPLTLVKDADTAARVGMTVDQARNATVGRVLKGYVMNTKTKVPGPDGLMTVGDRLHRLTGGSILNANPDIADAARGIEVTNSHFTSEERYVYHGVETAMEHVKTPEQEAALAELFNPAQESNLSDRMADPSLDPAVKAAAQTIIDGPLRFQEEETIAASDGPTRVTNPATGKEEIHTTTDHPTVATARDRMSAATAAILEKIPDLEKIKVQTDQAGQLFDSSIQKLEKANQDARQVKVDGNFTFKNIGDKRATGFAKSAIADKMFATGGFIDQLLNKAKEGRYEDTAFLANAALKRLDKWGTREVDAAADPAFQAVKAEVEHIHKVSKVMLELRKRADKEVHGAGKEWKGGKGFRDQQHKDEAKQLKQVDAQQRKDVIEARRVQFTRLRMAFKLKNREIRQRYATAKAQRDAQLRDGTQEINDRYGIEKAKVENRHLLARETRTEWLRGRRAQGLPASTDYIKAAEEGTRLTPGGLGSREAIEAGQTTLEVARLKELKDLEASLPTRAQLDLKMKGELRASEVAQAGMEKRLNGWYDKHQKEMGDSHKADEKNLAKDHVGKKAREGEISKAYKEWTDAQKHFSESVYRHPSDNKVDLFFNLFAKHLVANEKSSEVLAANEKALADKYDWGASHIEELRSNPQVMSQLVQLGIEGIYNAPMLEGVSREIIDEAKDSALKELDDLGKQGIFPQYIPHVSEAQLRADATGSYGIRTVVGRGIPKPDALSARTWGTNVSKYDLMAGLHRGTKQILDRSAIKDYVGKYLDPRVSTEEQLKDTVLKYYPSQVAGLAGQGLADFITARAKEWNLVQFDPQSRFGGSLPRWGQGKVYIDKDLLKAVEKLTNKDQLPTSATFEKATKLFRYSILGLSPRYTAHILFGGSFLLALRSTPYLPTFLLDAHRAIKNGDLPEDLLTSPTNMGTTDYKLSSKGTLDTFGKKAGEQTARLLAQEHIEVVQKVKHAAAQPLHWVKALADLNLHFTSHVSNMQRAMAYLDGAAKAERNALTDPITGEKLNMTKERMMAEGMHHAEQVMGDLRKMSPFERQVAKTVVPFYGWEKHILQYVLSFPADHPWRALMLSQMAEYDTENTPAGLPSRYQFLFFLGGADAQGNVTALDLRAANPLRDVANYATLGGLISSLNPVISGAVTAIDPSIIYGGNELYPNLTYDQFYGIEEAGPQGNLLTAAEGVVPQISAMHSALQLAGERQGMSGKTLVDNIFQSLNVPFAQPQHINLKQEAAKTAIAQYQVTSSLAKNAWQTGDFAPIEDLGAVPDPRNPEYETSVTDLQSMYDQLAKEYPGAPPSSVAPSLPSVHL